MKDSKEIRLAKVAGVSGIEGKIERLKKVGLGEHDYYQMEKDEPIPEGFYDGLDIVHISNPNEYHAEQTIDSLKHGKLTITEKTWATNQEEFERVAAFIGQNMLERKAYLHLHYLQKQLTMRLETLLEKHTKEQGKVTGVAETFFEVESEEDARRSGWLFSNQSGGLFMDWIHTFEIVVNGAKATRADLSDVARFAVNPSYHQEFPTGIEATVDLEGKFFANGAKSVMRMAKGTKEGMEAARFYFYSGAYLDLGYIHSETEFGSEKRGTWTLYRNGKAVESGCPKGLNTSEIFVNEILTLCKGGRAGLTLSEARLLFEPQWRYQELAKVRELHRSKEVIDKFVSEGLKLKQLD